MNNYLNTLFEIEKKLLNNSIKKILFISGNNTYNKTGANQ